MNERMTQTDKVPSIRRKYHVMMAIFVTFAFLATHVAVSYFVFEHLEEELKADIKARAAVVASRSVPYIQAGSFNEYSEVLERLSTIDRFNYVHIYHYNDKTLEFFSSYNKHLFPAIPDKISQISQFNEPLITEDKIEYIYPINANESVIGYAYLQLNIDHYHQLKTTSWLALIIGYLIVLVLGVFLVNRMHKMLTKPINELATVIWQVAQKRDFTKRCNNMSTLEFEILAKNFNIMLTRTERHLQKQDNAEQEILKLNHELEDKVNQRTEALKESNQELLSTLEKLHQFQGQLVENEKMASLGDMVAGVAHEVNTPIGLGVTASTLLSDRLNEIKDAFEDKTLKSSQLKRFLAEGQENVGIIYRNLNRAADLISSFKKVAVDQSSEEDRQFKVYQLIDEVILTLAPQLRNKPVDLQIDCDQTLTVISKPGPINQILINLIVNSIIHAFEENTAGIININIMHLSGQLHISYKDNGKGVDQALKNKIFDPFITTKRGEGGSGLGLHLVYNLVTQALGGHIQFDSEIDHGVHFEINFPATLVE